MYLSKSLYISWQVIWSFLHMCYLRQVPFSICPPLLSKVECDEFTQQHNLLPSSLVRESRAVPSVHIIAFSCAHQERATPTAMLWKWNACLCVRVCVSMCWPGHLRSAAACYVFLAKKRSITHTAPRIQFGLRRRLNQTWQDLNGAWQDSRPQAQHRIDKTMRRNVIRRN